MMERVIHFLPGIRIQYKVLFDIESFMTKKDQPFFSNSGYFRCQEKGVRRVFDYDLCPSGQLHVKGSNLIVVTLSNAISSPIRTRPFIPDEIHPSTHILQTKGMFMPK